MVYSSKTVEMITANSSTQPEALFERSTTNKVMFNKN